MWRQKVCDGCHLPPVPGYPTHSSGHGKRVPYRQEVVSDEFWSVCLVLQLDN